MGLLGANREAFKFGYFPLRATSSEFILKKCLVEDSEEKARRQRRRANDVSETYQESASGGVVAGSQRDKSVEPASLTVVARMETQEKDPLNKK